LAILWPNKRNNYNKTGERTWIFILIMSWT
jgi:hypothetical protein